MEKSLWNSGTKRRPLRLDPREQEVKGNQFGQMRVDWGPKLDFVGSVKFLTLVINVHSGRMSGTIRNGFGNKYECRETS